MSFKCYLRAGEDAAGEELDLLHLLRSRKGGEVVKDNVFVGRCLRGHLAEGSIIFIELMGGNRNQTNLNEKLGKNVKVQ